MPSFIFPGGMFPTTTSVMHASSSRSTTTTTSKKAPSSILLSDDDSEHTATSSTNKLLKEVVLIDSHDKEEKQIDTPLPKLQLFLLSIVLVCEPITASILFPFIYFMLRDFHLSDDEKQIGAYAGWITSMFFVAQLLTSIMWGKLSDRFGRRPVVLIGLFGNTVCSCLFGLSKSLTWAISSRTLCGIMNGNLGVARTAVTEITDETNRTKAFSLFGLCYGLGLIGPVLGGFLCNPVQQFPSIFGKNHFFETYPYFLPCFAAASISTVGFIVSYFFLNESSPYVLASSSSSSGSRFQQDGISETTPLLPKAPTKLLRKSSGSLEDVPKATYIIIVGFMVFTFHTLLFDEVLPLYFTAPSYAGGLSMTTREFARILTIFGAVQLIFLTTIYPRLAKYFDTLVLCRLACILLVIAYTLFPELTFVKEWSATTTSDTNAPSLFFTLSYAILLTIRFIAHITIHTAFSIIVSISAPPELTGVVNGVVSSALSLGRAISPTFGGTVWSYSLQKGQVYPFDHHLVYYIIAGMALFNVVHSYCVPKSLALGGRQRQSD